MRHSRADSMIGSDPRDFFERPDHDVPPASGLAAEVLAPQPASVFVGKGQRALDFPHILRVGARAVLDSERPDVKNVVVDLDLDVDPVELAASQSIPCPDCLPDAFRGASLLDPVM